jgi:dimeric dUTPase (all-alpha-NTP-PPase superfamily)
MDLQLAFLVTLSFKIMMTTMRLRSNKRIQQQITRRILILIRIIPTLTKDNFSSKTMISTIFEHLINI